MKNIWLGLIFLPLLSWAQKSQPLSVDSHGRAWNLPSQFKWDIILNGEKVEADEHAAQSAVRLVMSFAGKSKTCTGVIISRNLILTAGHCLDGNKEDIDITVHFGLGGKHKFIEKKALAFRAYEKQPLPPGSSPWRNGALTYDQNSQKDFYTTVEKLDGLQNLANYYDTTYEIGLVKIDQIPAGYKASKLFTGEVSFQQEVYATGFGTNHRRANQQDTSLRYSLQKVIGTIRSLSDPHPIGWQVYSPEGLNICYGDSGGPTFIKNPESEEWEIFGINSKSYNRCANYSLLTYPGYPEISSMVEQWAEEMGTSVEL